MLYDDDEILFKSEGSSIHEYWNEVEVVDFKNNLKLKRVLYEICKRQLIEFI